MTLLPLTRSEHRRQLTVERSMLFLLPQASNSPANAQQASGQGESTLSSGEAQFGHLLNAAFHQISANGETSEVASTAEPVVPLQQIPPEWQSALAIAASIRSEVSNSQALVNRIEGHQVDRQLADSSQLEPLSVLATPLDSDAALQSLGQLPEVAIEQPTLAISAAASTPNDGTQQLSLNRSSAEAMFQDVVRVAQGSELRFGDDGDEFQVDSTEQPSAQAQVIEDVPAIEDSFHSVLSALQADDHATDVRTPAVHVPQPLAPGQFDEITIDRSTSADHGDDEEPKPLSSLSAGLAPAETDQFDQVKTSPRQQPGDTLFGANDPDVAAHGGIDRVAHREASVPQQSTFSEGQQASTGEIDGATGIATNQTFPQSPQGRASDAHATREAADRNRVVKQNPTPEPVESQTVAEPNSSTRSTSAASSASTQLVNQIASNADSREGSTGPVASGELAASAHQVDRPRALDQPSAAIGAAVSDIVVSDIAESTTDFSAAIERATLQSPRTDTTSSIARSGHAPQSPVPGQVATAVQEAVETNVTPLRVRLDPPELGSIAVEIRRDAGQLQIEIQFESSDALRAARDGVDSLRESLSAKGIDVDAEQVRLKLEIGREPKVADSSAADNEERSTGRDSQSRDQTDQQRSNENRHGFGDPRERREGDRPMTAAHRFDEQTAGIADETTPIANTRRRSSGNVRSLDIEI